MRVSDPTAEAIAVAARDTSHDGRVGPWRTHMRTPTSAVKHESVSLMAEASSRKLDCWLGDGRGHRCSWRVHIAARRFGGSGHSLKTARCAAVVPGLNRRALHRAEGAEHATVAGLGSESSVALRAFVNDKARCSRHDQPLSVAAGRTSQDREQLHAAKSTSTPVIAARSRFTSASAARPSASSP